MCYTCDSKKAKQTNKPAFIYSSVKAMSVLPLLINEQLTLADHSL